MKMTIAAALILLAGGAHAQTVTDGSDAGVPKDLLQTLTSRIAKEAFDPAAVQFRNLRTKQMDDWGTTLCGEVNGKNRFGGYIGYQPFFYAPKADDALVNAADFSDDRLRSTTATMVRTLCL